MSKRAAKKITSFFSKKPKTDYNVILSDEEQGNITAEVLQMKSGNLNDLKTIINLKRQNL